MVALAGAEGKNATTINGHFKLDRSRLCNGISHTQAGVFEGERASLGLLPRSVKIWVPVAVNIAARHLGCMYIV